MMKRASLKIRGNVQMAGFQTFIKNVADSLNVNGFAENEMVALMRSFDKKGEVMIGILGSMNETLKGVKGDTSRILEKQDETIDAIDQSKKEIVTEISSLREDLRSYMGEKFAKIEYELEAIKAKIGMV